MILILYFNKQKATRSDGILKKIKLPLLSILVGFLNGLFGAGGGMIAVPMLKSNGLPVQKSHATSIAMILPLCILSGYFYFKNGHFALQEALPFIPGAVLGAVVGAFLLKKIHAIWLKRIFGVLIIYASIRILLK